nr:hypothetical protein [Russula virescens]
MLFIIQLIYQSLWPKYNLWILPIVANSLLTYLTLNKINMWLLGRNSWLTLSQNLLNIFSNRALEKTLLFTLKTKVSQLYLDLTFLNLIVFYKRNQLKLYLNYFLLIYQRI